MSRSSATSVRSFVGALTLGAHLVSTGRAVAQVGPQDIDTCRPVDLAPAVNATQNPPTTASRRPGPYGRPFLAVLTAVPLVTYVGPLAPRPSEVVFPADRFVMTQLIGAGYVVNPRFRFGVMGVFSEALTGLPTGAATWQLGGVAPLAIGTFDHFIVGGGPIIGYRSGGQLQSDVGMVVLAGASIPIRSGLAVNLAMPVTAMFTRRVTASAGVAVGVSKVF
jgi:hypothetical protein